MCCRQSYPNMIGNTLYFIDVKTGPGESRKTVELATMYFLKKTRTTNKPKHFWINVCFAFVSIKIRWSLTDIVIAIAQHTIDIELMSNSWSLIRMYSFDSASEPYIYVRKILRDPWAIVVCRVLWEWKISCLSCLWQFSINDVGFG